MRDRKSAKGLVRGMYPNEDLDQADETFKIGIFFENKPKDYYFAIDYFRNLFQLDCLVLSDKTKLMEVAKFTRPLDVKVESQYNKETDRRVFRTEKLLAAIQKPLKSSRAFIETVSWDEIVYLHYPGYNKWAYTIFIFDPSKQSIKLRRLPEDQSFNLEDSRIAQIGLTVYVLSWRYRNAIKLQKLNKLDSCFPDAKALTFLQKHMEWFSVSVANRRYIYVTGGIDDDLKELTNAWVYDTAADRWLTIPESNEGRYSHASVVVAQSLYIIGGRTR